MSARRALTALAAFVGGWWLLLDQWQASTTSTSKAYVGVGLVVLALVLVWGWLDEGRRPVVLDDQVDAP